MALPEAIANQLRCPCCGGELQEIPAALQCSQAACVRQFPIEAGTPILIAPGGVYKAADFLSAAQQRSAGSLPQPTRTQRISALLPGPFRVAASEARLRDFVARARAACAPARPQILLVCAAEATRLRTLLEAGGAQVSCLGTAPGVADVDALCDPAHLPFPDALFDGIVAHQVLHRSLAPAQAAAQLARVARSGSLLYAEEPFVQATLEGPDDFHRFTHLGLRGLFLGCEERDSGILEGPGSAVAAAWRQLAWSLPRSAQLGFLFAALGSLQAFFWKYLDPGLARRARALDGAAAVFFLGSKAEVPMQASELIAGYRGAAARRGTARPKERPPNEVFTEWAADGRDVGMEIGHAAAVSEMLAAALSLPGLAGGFRAVDAGCGNGWLVRRLRASPGCTAATGVDGSAGMIARARALDPSGHYEIGQLMSWQPAQPVDLVVSMEVLYYLEDPVALLRRIATLWLRPGGYAVIGIDHYKENEPSLGWPEFVGTKMATWPEAQWLSALEAAGFTRVRHWRAAPGPNWAGTLVMLVRAP